MEAEHGHQEVAWLASHLQVQVLEVTIMEAMDMEVMEGVVVPMLAMVMLMQPQPLMAEILPLLPGEQMTNTVVAVVVGLCLLLEELAGELQI